MALKIAKSTKSELKKMLCFIYCENHEHGTNHFYNLECIYKLLILKIGIQIQETV